ncbi:MAG: hypothetical protein F6K23_18635 [Okeania sp. SIO2C9]|uniref:hypothetical protein n=1 Tax=Okeania sp. SIO2C9 TaxID=2607791 RepID=UPI0013C0B2BB|nr:hypothetical protein [Okeania sp. SIO2C9]NEQ74879.1 hypothetical protein [Okeania sp. SIO2C9]
MKNLMDEYNKYKSQDEQDIYNHFIQLIDLESSTEVIERFRILFINGSGYPDREISQALDRITALPEIEEDFNFILNRCCHIVINRKQPYNYKKDVLVELMKLFERVENKQARRHYYGSRNSKKLLELVQGFTTSEQYLSLKRLTELINQETGSYKNTNSALAQPLRTLIPRYPYLYQHCLVTPDSSYEHQQVIRKIQRQKQRKFEIDLSKYVTHKIRQRVVSTASERGATLSNLTVARWEGTNNIQNPTLLSDREVLSAIKLFVGKVENGNNYRDNAKSFLTHVRQPQSYHSFKESFYEYLSTSFDVDSKSIKHQFQDKLYKQLKNTMSHSNDKQFNDFLLMRTCNQMLGFLIVESTQKPQHFIFLNLMANLGPIKTIGLLLKIVLVCYRVKPYLEKRFSILFNHYESHTRETVMWLVKALENMHVALSTNFGRVDLSFIR